MNAMIIKYIVIFMVSCAITGLVLGLRPAIEGRRYKVTPSFIGWAQAQNQPLIPHPVASEHRWLVKAPRWIHSVPDVSGKRSWRCGCQARL